MSKNERETEKIVRKKLEKAGITEDNGFLVKKQKNVNFDCDLEYAGSLIAEGFITGYYPYWKLSFSGIPYWELSDATSNHISQLVADGYVEGEVIENYQNQFDRGWWKLQT